MFEAFSLSGPEVCDNAGNHRYVKQLLLGNKKGIAENILANTPFFSQLTYEAMPQSVIANMNFFQPFYKGEAIFCLNGPPHLQKNLASALRGAKQIYVGRYFVDLQGALDCDMPPAAYCGFDSQSDMLASILLNPYHYVTEVPSSLEEVQVPWCLQGALVLNVIFALGQSAATHPTMTPLVRAENALTSFVLIDLCMILADDMASNSGMRKGSLFLSKVTCHNYQELCAFVILQCLHLPPGLRWTPDKGNELVLEQWFGHIRSQYVSSQVTVRDFLHGSSKKCRPISTRPRMLVRELLCHAGTLTRPLQRRSLDFF